MDEPQQTTRASTPASLDQVFVHLRNDERADPVEVNATFWQELIGGDRPELESGRLVMMFQFSQDWSSWERHPAGEEVVLLVSGAADLVLEVDGVEQVAPLRQPGEHVLVPPGVWHTARTRQPCQMLFITAGRGTEHRPAT